MNPPLLDIQGLKTQFFTYTGVVRAVDGIDLAVNREEVVGIVGETGCGKSVAVRSVLRLIPEPGRIVAGRILLDGENVMDMGERDLQLVRGGRIAMIFQNPLSSLNPVFTIGEQVSRVARIHQGLDRSAAGDLCAAMFEQVRLPDPKKLLGQYPHELSGGQLQRVMIAMALSCRPELLIADEPTTALDVTIQAQILTLMLRLREETQTAILLITHDLGVVAEVCDRVAVMYAGLIVEQGPVGSIYADPGHPYTQGLLASIPARARRGREFQTISGVVPSLVHPPEGCRFHPRCPFRRDVCLKETPVLAEGRGGRRVACHLRGKP
ncbi:MAG: ABC transporter ATP-binding protein [Thermodesulfobacteriota bacterium]